MMDHSSPLRLRPLTHVGVEGWLGDAKRAADLFHCVLSLCVKVASQRTLLGIEALGSPALPAPCPRRFEPSLGPLLDEIALELGESPEDVEDKLPAGGRGVDVLLKALKADALVRVRS